MRNFNETLLTAREESKKRQNDLEEKLEQTPVIGKTNSAGIQIRQFICMNCGRLTNRCICNTISKNRHSQKLYNSSVQFDLSCNAEIAQKPEISYVNPKLVSGTSAMQEFQKNMTRACNDVKEQISELMGDIGDMW